MIAPSRRGKAKRARRRDGSPAYLEDHWCSHLGASPSRSWIIQVYPSLPVVMWLVALLAPWAGKFGRLGEVGEA